MGQDLSGKIPLKNKKIDCRSPLSGDTKSLAQVQSKIRKLLDVYKETKFLNSKSGGDPHDRPFYEVFDEIIGLKR